MASEVVDETHDLPEGTNWLVYGASVFVAGTYLAVTNLTPWVGGFLALAGLWFVFGGVTTIRYEPFRTEHEYVSGLDDEMGEMMLRMQTLNVVYQALRDTPEPQSLLLTLTLLNHASKVPLDFWKTRAVLSEWGTSIVRSHPGGAGRRPSVSSLYGSYAGLSAHSIGWPRTLSPILI